MALYVDHAFITCEAGAPEAEILLRYGLVEGSPNAHPGQGTANRRFFFENFMLELLWVSDPVAAASEPVRVTGLWERWSGRNAGASRFGIVLTGQPPADSGAPFATQSYLPSYLPAGMRFEIAQGLRHDEPMVVWIPTPDCPRARPKHEPPSISEARFSRLAVGLSDPQMLSAAATRLRQAGLVEFTAAPAPLLVIGFSSPKDIRLDCRPVLPLLLQGVP